MEGKHEKLYPQEWNALIGGAALIPAANHGVCI